MAFWDYNKACQLIDSVTDRGEDANIDNSERLISALAGCFLVFSGVNSLFSKPGNGLALVLLGSGLIYRGTSGYCPVKDKLMAKTDQHTDEDEQQDTGK